MAFVFGVVADDFTGATDLASFFRKRGLRVLQLIGRPDRPASDFADDYDVLVVALKSRTIPPAEAVTVSLDALDWLREGGCDRYYFKYCSTFDSTERGNIGPVAEAMLNALDERLTIFCPALPVMGRTVYKSTLFVGDVRLDESSMKDHPLTPMRDANLARLLEPQVSGNIGKLDHSVVRRGGTAIRRELADLRAQGVRFVIADAIDDDDLRALGDGARDLRLITGGSGLAIGVLVDPVGSAPRDIDVGESDRAVIIAGSSSAMTNRQVEEGMKHFPHYRISALDIASGRNVTDEALAWADANANEPTMLFYATAVPSEVKQVQEKLGVDVAGKMVEDTLAAIAAGVVERGVRTVVVAGGETSGAVVKSLGVTALEIGEDLAPGVPWTSAIGSKWPIRLALKSGNFGGPELFLEARGIQ